MRIIALFLLFAWAAQAADPMAAELDQVARIATAMVDGDLVRKIPTERSVRMMLTKNPRDHWADADNYDVHHEPFVATKKTLIRLSTLCSQPCDVNLWMPIPSNPPRVEVVIRNSLEISQFWRWGDLTQEMVPEMKEVLDSGKRLTVERRPGMVSVLAPVYDSLGDIAGLVEVVSERNPDPQENVK
ncbi:MAG: hypothetical protein LC114_23285 [Bryobacterales bacterium]|nr:hypothetical protein [Bryobacterales bacterium]